MDDLIIPVGCNLYVDSKPFTYTKINIKKLLDTYSCGVKYFTALSFSSAGFEPSATYEERKFIGNDYAPIFTAVNGMDVPYICTSNAFSNSIFQKLIYL